MNQPPSKPSVPPPQQLSTRPASQNRPVVVDSAQLFDGGHEVWIEHKGDVYRLQETRAAN